ncbi:MAG: serine hydrolase [Clostridia bacterium]|nr:serine hydrolase [Clostridia bacterium]
MNKSQFDTIVNEYLIRTDKDGNRLKMDSIIISDSDGNYFKHCFSGNDGLHAVRSVCKSVVSMCLGIVMSDKDHRYTDTELTFDTKVWPIIKDKVNLTNVDNLARLEKLTMFNLFTHSIGFNVKLLKSKDVKGIDPTTYLDLVCNTPLVYEPGESFLYSNAAPFLLAVVFQEITGINLADFANEHIFKKIGINSYAWRNYGKYCAGSTGLELQSDDLHKIAQLIANDGKYNGRQIIPAEWIIKMRTPQVLTPSMYDEQRVFPKYAYGLLMWVCGNEVDSNYFIDGSNGQYIIIIPKKKLVITTLADQSDMKPITVCLRSLIS